MNKFIKKVLATFQSKQAQVQEERKRNQYNENFKLFLQEQRTGF